MSEDTELLRRFIDAFDGFDRRISSAWEGDVTSLLVDPWDEHGWSEWRPVPADLRPDTLRTLHAHVPGPLPPLYERLILSYRWAQIDVDRLTLFGNLPPGLSGLAAAITRDEGLFEALAPIKCVQFGRGTDMDYDPVCFDLRRRDANGDCPVVMFDHEEILCNRRIVQVEELAPSFRSLVMQIVEGAEPKA